MCNEVHSHANELQPTPSHQRVIKVMMLAHRIIVFMSFGPYSPLDIDDCKLAECQNGGTCVDRVNSYQCICPQGWEGPNCSISKLCPVFHL